MTCTRPNVRFTVMMLIPEDAIEVVLRRLGTASTMTGERAISMRHGPPHTMAVGDSAR